MPNTYQSKAYKEWAEEQDSEIKTRQKTGGYPVWQYVAESLGMMPEKGLAWVADKDRDASKMHGGEFVSAGDIRQGLFEQMRTIAGKQHQGQQLSETEKKAASDWQSLVNTGTVYFP